jgi:sporulation protein YlmC with PRC-barrel domain
MSMKTVALALALGTMIAAPAIAQDNNANQAQTQNQAAAAPSGEFMTQAQKGEYRASKFVGINIYNNNDENIGEINEVMVDKDGSIKAVVIGVGGFLGIGEKNVALPFKSIQWVDTPRASAAATNPPANTTTANNTAATGNDVAATGNNTAATNNMAGNNTGLTGTGTGAAGTDATGTVAAANMNRDFPDHGMINMSKDQLQNAPEFKYFSDAQ